MPHIVTIFQNIRETETPFIKDVTYILQRIKNGKNQDLVKKIRAEKDKSKRKILFKINCGFVKCLAFTIELYKF